MKYRLLFFNLFAGICAFAQSFETGLSYNYLYAGQWDNLIQTYNFARPFLVEKQPLLKHGAQVYLAYRFKSEKRISHGIQLSYSYFRSSAENAGFTNTLGFSALNVGYILHYENETLLKRVYAELIVAATGGRMQRRINNAPFEYDQKRAKALGIGGNVGTKLGYHLKINEAVRLSPFVLLSYTPYFYAPDAEVLINQTRGLVAEDWTGMLNAQFGLALKWK
ncbi:MAG: hypothetical protein IT236_07990 [Bacteroidia bacterium]|nr:hypothetical protein [Bacteroidia bacterium]